MAEQPTRASVLGAAREADWVPRPRKDIDYPQLDEPPRGRNKPDRYCPPKYEARLQHALDGVIRLWGHCSFCDRLQPIDPERVLSQYRPSSLLRDLERHLRCTGCGARAWEGANIDLLYRGSWETDIPVRQGKPIVWVPREPRPKLFGRRSRYER